MSAEPPKICAKGTSGQDCINPPRAVVTPEPQYTDRARAARLQGTVILRVAVSAKGDPGRIDVVHGVGLGLDESAIDAVSHWKFEPARHNGKAVPLSIDVQVAFRLTPNPENSLASQDSQKLYADAAAAASAHDCATALGMFRRVTEMQPSHSVAWNATGMCQLEIGDLGGAEASFKKQIEVTPQTLYAYNNLGRVYLRQRRYEEAAAQFRRQIEINPNDRFSHMNLGIALRRRGDYANAIHELQAAAAVRVEDPSPHFEMADCLFKLGRKDAAGEEIDKAAALTTTASGWNTLAWILADNKEQLDKAGQYGRMSLTMQVAGMGKLSIDPVTPGAFAKVNTLAVTWDTLGWVFFLQGKKEEAATFTLASWLLDPRPTITDHLSQIYEALGKTQDAARYAALAAAALATTPEPQDSDVSAAAQGKARLSKLVPRVSEALGMQDLANAEAQRGELVNIANDQHLSGEAEFAILQGASSASSMSRMQKGSESLRSLEAKVAQIKPATFPDDARPQIVRWSVLTCKSEAEPCSLKLLDSNAAYRTSLQGAVKKTLLLANITLPTFTSATLGVSLQLPEGWKKTHEVGDVQDTPGPSVWFNKTDSLSYFTVWRQHLALSAEDFDRGVQSQIGASGEVRRRSQSSVNRNGVAGTRSILDYQQNGIDFLGIVETFSIGNLHYILLAGAPREQFENVSGELQALFGSVQFMQAPPEMYKPK